MMSALLNQGRKLLPWLNSQIQTNRMLHVSAVCQSQSSGRYNNVRSKTYEMLHGPHGVGRRKAWNSWNTSNLKGGLRPSQTAIEDAYIRKFISGTFPTLLCSEIIIKRHFNIIRVAFILRRGIGPSKVYFLSAYTEELLSHWLQCPVLLEIQTVNTKEDTIVKKY